MITSLEKDIKKQMEAINNIHQQFLVKLNLLKKEQKKILDRFVKSVETREIERISKKIQS